MTTFFFWIFAGIAVAAALLAITRKRALACALSLVVSFVGLSGLYVQLGAAFPAALQIMLYAGAVMVLVVFVIMFLNLPEEALERQASDRRERLWPVFLVLPLGVVLVGLVNRVDLPPVATPPPDFGSVAATGRVLFERYVYPFELVSVLLLVAIVGAVVIAKRRLA
jgi:NADH-quinone oxidoreductase subunit J